MTKEEFFEDQIINIFNCMKYYEDGDRNLVVKTIGLDTRCLKDFSISIDQSPLPIHDGWTYKKGTGVNILR